MIESVSVWMDTKVHTYTLQGGSPTPAEVMITRNDWNVETNQVVVMRCVKEERLVQSSGPG